MWKFSYLVATLMLTTSTAIAQTPTTVAPLAKPIASEDKSDVNRIVCKREETIGSRLAAKKVCLTVQEWQARQQDDRDQLEKGQSDTRARRST